MSQVEEAADGPASPAWKVGDQVDVLSPEGIYCPATILSIKKSKKDKVGYYIRYIGWGHQHNETVEDMMRILPSFTGVIKYKAWVKLSNRFPAWPCIAYIRQPKVNDELAIQELKLEKKVYIVPCGKMNKFTQPFFHGVWIDASNFEPYTQGQSHQRAEGLQNAQKGFAEVFDEAVKDCDSRQDAEMGSFKFHGSFEENSYKCWREKQLRGRRRHQQHHKAANVGKATAESSATQLPQSAAQISSQSLPIQSSSSRQESSRKRSRHRPAAAPAADPSSSESSENEYSCSVPSPSPNENGASPVVIPPLPHSAASKSSSQDQGLIKFAAATSDICISIDLYYDSLHRAKAALQAKKALPEGIRPLCVFEGNTMTALLPGELPQQPSRSEPAAVVSSSIPHSGKLFRKSKCPRRFDRPLFVEVDEVYTDTLRCPVDGSLPCPPLGDDNAHR